VKPGGCGHPPGFVVLVMSSQASASHWCRGSCRGHVELTGDRDRATEMHRQVLAERERLYRPDHPHTEIARPVRVKAETQATDHERPNDPDSRQAED